MPFHSPSAEVIDLPADWQRLVEAALAVRAHAHAPYSHFFVGAALLTHAGRLFSGANVENSSFSLTICAERTALGAAVSAGERQFGAMAIASAGGAAPCGACRQFLAEFGDWDLILIDCNLPNVARIASLADLLPQQFRLGN